MKNEIAKRYRLCTNCSDRILSRRCNGKCKEYWKYIGATEQKAIDEAMLKGFTTDELRAELKRRAAEEKAKNESILRCRMCKHWGAIDYWGHPTNYAVGNNRSCKFFKTKNGKYYRCHRASQLACEHFERREE